MLEEQLRDLMHDANPTVAPYAKTGEVHLRITARARSVEEAEALIEPCAQAITGRVGRHLYGQDDEDLAAACLRLLRGRGAALATVESCTGGGLGEFLTSVPGSSESYVGGFITYSNEQKTAMVGVPRELLEEFGEVSAECALAMARGGRNKTGADYCLSITGVAGPGGGTEEKPVGLVYVACAQDGEARVVRSQWMGTREAVRERAQKSALNLLRLMILKLED
jgi:nicotinamide-nucleotide amidase